MTVLQSALAALAISLGCSFLVWAVSVMRHNVALADRAWSILIMAMVSKTRGKFSSVSARLLVATLSAGAGIGKLFGPIR
jgi:steroid 5-alpha reductase family enzyme